MYVYIHMYINLKKRGECLVLVVLCEGVALALRVGVAAVSIADDREGIA
jgi:hypothetical protein